MGVKVGVEFLICVYIIVIYAFFRKARRALRIEMFFRRIC
jgi:hypothetical protein